ncbi:MAG: protein-L-isoaspartate O-methyltransferase [Gammaproteobacteria bacterium]|nr:protein-L-isoaspartate O-methyltransferase [Gammaproteobacteria bacterium]
MTMDFQQARFNMVEQQIRTWDVLDQGLLDALLDLPRDGFVPDDFRQLAYCDTRIPLGNGQFMMHPRVEARMVQALNPAAGERALEIGTGSGYVTALLAHFARNVLTYEIDPALAALAQRRFRARAAVNITSIAGDGLSGAPTRGPFDVIAVTGALMRRSVELESQLATGGRLFAVVGQGHAMEALLVTRTSAQTYTVESLFETELEPLVGAEPIPRFAF